MDWWFYFGVFVHVSANVDSEIWIRRGRTFYCAQKMLLIERRNLKLLLFLLPRYLHTYPRANKNIWRCILVNARVLVLSLYISRILVLHRNSLLIRPLILLLLLFPLSFPLPNSQSTTYYISSRASLISSIVILFSSPAKSLSSVRKSMQWHSFRSRIGMHGQFQKPAFTSASLSS